VRGGDDPPIPCEGDVRRFVAGCCEPGESALAHDVEHAFERWCLAEVLVPLAWRYAARELGRMGYPSRRVWQTGRHVSCTQGSRSDREFQVRIWVRTRRAFPGTSGTPEHGTMRFSLNHAAVSGPCRDRTCDLGIKSPLLYQLS
jgi:hypothetical protein